MTTTAPPRTFEEIQDVLAAKLDGYTRRDPQIRLGTHIQTAVSKRRKLLAQAGTGTGKSLAGLIPLIEEGRRAIVVTYTKALQTQYARHDLPFLHEHLGKPFTSAIIKGRSNYACHAKMAELKDPTPGQAKVLRAVKEAEDKGLEISGDRDELPRTEDRDWALLSMSASECPGNTSCPFAKQCFTEKAKAAAAEADVVITNQAYWVTDRKLRQQTGGTVSLLGDAAAFVIDEAHNLEDSVTGALSDSVGVSAFTFLARDADNFFHQLGLEEIAFRITAAARILWDQVEAVYAAHLAANNIRKPEPMTLRLNDLIGPFADNFAMLVSAVTETREAVNAYRPDPDDTKIKMARWRLLRRLGDWRTRLIEFATDPDDLTVRWIEQEDAKVQGRTEKRTYLRSAPIHVGDFLRKNLWDATDDDGEPVAVVLMSATLATGSDFGYVTERLGLRPGEAGEFMTPSPFNYPKQAMLYVPPADTPEPRGNTTPAWRAWAMQATRHLVFKANGGALLLFTSRSGLEETYKVLADDFRQAGLTVLKQDGVTPVSELIATFKKGKGVLFGLKSFFEGVDVQGPACRLVVIDKLPFAVPTDVLVKARCEAYERKFRKSSFGGMAVPTMVLVLTQGFGRLIRHINDKGVVAILDPRLTSKGYGKGILAKLPDAPVTTDIHKAAAFLQGS